MVTLLLNDEVTQFSFKHENGRSRVINQQGAQVGDHRIVPERAQSSSDS
jgi:hypothetical protein